MSGLAPDHPCEEMGYDIQLVRGGQEIPRGQKSRLARLDYSRVLDAISTASVDIYTPCYESCGQLAIVDHWNTDLAITHGPSRTVVWRGPVTKVRYRKSSVIVEAEDLLAWATKRIVPETIDIDGDVSEIAEALWQAAVASVNEPYHKLIVNTSGVTEQRKVTADQRRKLWNVYQEMLTAGLDVTTFGSRVLLGMPQFTPITMDDSMVIGDVEVVKDGEDMANRIIGDASADIVGIYPDQPRSKGGTNNYPLLEEVLTDGGLQTQASVDNAAKARYDFSSRGIRRVQATGGLRLLPSSQIDPKKLIAGQLVNFTAKETCYTATETLRLGNLRIEAVGGEESATIDLQPLGSVPGAATV